MNTKLRKKEKNDFKKYYLKLMNSSVFVKTINVRNVRKRHKIKIITHDKRKNYLASEPNYHTTKSDS